MTIPRVLEVVEPKKELKITVPVGTRFPFYTSALMKVFFSQMKNEEIVRFGRGKPLARVYGAQRHPGRRPPRAGGKGAASWDTRQTWKSIA